MDSTKRQKFLGLPTFDYSLKGLWAYLMFSLKNSGRKSGQSRLSRSYFTKTTTYECIIKICIHCKLQYKVHPKKVYAWNIFNDPSVLCIFMSKLPSKTATGQV